MERILRSFEAVILLVVLSCTETYELKYDREPVAGSSLVVTICVLLGIAALIIIPLFIYWRCRRAGFMSQQGVAMTTQVTHPQVQYTTVTPTAAGYQPPPVHGYQPTQPQDYQPPPYPVYQPTLPYGTKHPSEGNQPSTQGHQGHLEGSSAARYTEDQSIDSRQMPSAPQPDDDIPPPPYPGF